MHECSLLSLHRLESEALCFRISSEQSQLLLLRRSPSRVLLIHVHRCVGVWYVIALVLGIHVQSKSQLVISLETRALLVALQDFLRVALTLPGGCTLRLVLDPLTLASDKDLVLARLFFFARVWEVAWSHTRMATGAELLATRLPTRFLALPGAMALLLTFVGAASKCLSTDVTATDVR